MTMTERAIKELKLAGLYDKESDYNGAIGKSVEKLLKVFEKQGHSGFSAHTVADIFHKVALGGILTPLQGTPNEWKDVSTEMEHTLYQNQRCYEVFASDENGKDAYRHGGIVFIDKDGVSFTCGKSSVPITFPYTPTTIYIKEGTPEAEPYKSVFED